VRRSLSLAHRARAALAFGAAAAAVLLGACSSTPAGSTTSTSGTVTTSSTPGATSAATTTTFDEALNARQDVSTDGVCQRSAAGVLVWHGTVTNGGVVHHSYRIIVDFTDESATVVQTKVVTIVGLAPGRTAGWSVSGAAGRSDILCVIRNARIF
jgi:hypothetical protein